MSRRDYNRVYTATLRRQRIEADLCTECGSPHLKALETDSGVARRCAACLEQYAARQREYRKRQRTGASA